MIFSMCERAELRFQDCLPPGVNGRIARPITVTIRIKMQPLRVNIAGEGEENTRAIFCNRRFASGGAGSFGMK